MSDADKVGLVELAALATEDASTFESALKISGLSPAELENTSIELLQTSLSVLTHLLAMGELNHHGQLLNAKQSLGKLIAEADLNITVR